MKSLQICVHLRHEVQPIDAQIEDVRWSKLLAGRGYSAGACGKCKAGISLLHNAVSRKGEFSRGRIVASGNIWEVVDPDSCLRIDHRQIATWLPSKLITDSIGFLDSLTIYPSFWYIGIPDPFLMPLNRFKMRRQQISTI